MSSWPYPLWLAHRGAGRLAPENTLAAFRLGASFGYRAFECDVKLSADDQPFLLHDAELERTSNGHGVAGTLAWATLSRLDAGSWHSPAYAGEPLPSLDAIAAFIRGNGLALNIELKPTPGVELHTGRVVAAAARMLWQGDAQQPVLSSFWPEALSGAKEAAPELPRALLLDTLWPGCLELATGLGCVAVVTNHALMNAELLGRLHAMGLHGCVYTVNDAARARELLALGVASIITDAVDQFSPAITAAGMAASAPSAAS